MKKRTRAAAWIAAPKAMFTVRHPKKAALLGATGWAASRMKRRKRRPSMASMAARGLGTAAVAVPLGMWVGRKVRGRGRHHAAEAAHQPA
jgi:hypothetical protein